MRQSPLLTALLIVIVLLLAATLSRAETSAAPAPDQAAERQADAFLSGLAGRVDLSAAEQAAVRPILVDNLARKARLLRERAGTANAPLDRDALKADFQAINHDTRAKLSATLPPRKLLALGRYLQETRREAAAARGTTARDG